MAILYAINGGGGNSNLRYNTSTKFIQAKDTSGAWQDIFYSTSCPIPSGIVDLALKNRSDGSSSTYPSSLNTSKFYRSFGEAGNYMFNQAVFNSISTAGFDVTQVAAEFGVAFPVSVSANKTYSFSMKLTKNTSTSKVACTVIYYDSSGYLLDSKRLVSLDTVGKSGSNTFVTPASTSTALLVFLSLDEYASITSVRFAVDELSLIKQ